jgi:hypothetical protein
VTATLDMILDATSRLAGKHPSQLSDEELGITCAKSDPNLATFIRQWITEFGLPYKVGRATAIKNSLADSGESLQQQGAMSMESRLSPRDAQKKAQTTHEAFGDSAGAPALLNGETTRDYRVRLLSQFKKHSKIYKDIDLNNVQDETAFTAIEDAIYADAVAALRDPANFKRGVLIPQKIRDSAGREITKYIGQDGACWDQFNPPIRHVRRFNTSGRVA